MMAPFHRPSTRTPDKQGGSVLVLTLIFTTVVVTTIVTFGRSVRNQVVTARESNSSLNAELAAQSGIEYAKHHLLEDMQWSGSGRVLLTTDSSFEVTRLGSTTTGPATEVVDLLVEGFSKDAEYRLEVQAQVDYGDPLATNALVSLGGSVTLHNSSQTGDMMIVDEVGHVWDWYPYLNSGQGDWQLGGPDPIGSFNFSSNQSDGTLWKYTDTLYQGFDTQAINPHDIYMPAWNLDVYLDPGPDRVFYTNVTSLTNLEHEETVVVQLKPRQSLEISDCKFHGGLVVHMEGDYPYRDGPRNTVTMKGTNIVGGGELGVHPHVGFLAPGCYVRGNSALMHGFSMWNEAFTSVMVGSDGQLIVINDIKNMNYGDMVWDPEVTSDPPPGVNYHGGEPSVDVLLVRESYDSPDL